MNTIFKSISLLLASGSFVCASAQQVTPPSSNVPIAPALTPAAISSYPDLIDYSGSSTTLVNAVRSFTPQKPTTSSSNISIDPTIQGNYPCETVSAYFDGLGRPLQEVKYKGTGTGMCDMVTVHTYDVVGREENKYLPFNPTFGSYHGKLDLTPLSDLDFQYNWFMPGQEPYCNTVFDGSPLNRPVKEMSPGHSWVGSGRGKTIAYLSAQVVVDFLPSWTVGFTPTSTPAFNGYYPDGEIELTRVTDEDGHITEEFKDKMGRVVCKRVAIATPSLFLGYNSNDWLHTYYVYDDLGHLRWVLSPEAIKECTALNTWQLTGAQLDGLCYRYWYDEKGRLIEKQLPGKQTEYFVYDQRNRPVLTQDGNLRSNGQNKWAFTTYDALDRPLSTGIFDAGSSTQQQLAAALASASGSYTTSSLLYYLYTTNLFNTRPGVASDRELLSYAFYDDYTNTPATSFDPSLNSLLTGTAPYALTPGNSSRHTRGLATGTSVKVMDGTATPPWITTASFYDDFGRTIQTQSNNLHVGGKNTTTFQYDFAGTLVSSVLDHVNPNAISPDPKNPSMHVDTKIVRRFNKIYSNGNVQKLEQNINNTSFRTIYSLTWDRFGRVQNKNLDAADNVYSYNIRGWLTGINKSFIDANNGAQTTFFHEELNYDDGFASKLYSGNIAGIRWRGAGNSAPKRYYGYSYDLAERLKHAEFSEAPAGTYSWSKANTDFTASGITYDYNGNIQYMAQRGPGVGGPVDMDLMTYDYSGNQLKKVTESPAAATSTLAPDFKDGSNTGDDYTYDPNGNLLTDQNKGITSNISYSYLNKPTHIAISGKGTIDYVYDALGNKLKKVVFDQSTSATTTTEYDGPFVYENNSLKYILHEEGRCRPNPVAANGVATYQYDYFIKDHLNNVRTVINSQASSVGPILEYNTGLEVAQAATDAIVWDKLDDVRSQRPGGTNGNTMAAELNGAVDEQRVATMLMLRAMPGDRFSLSAQSYYQAIGTNNASTTSDLTGSLLSALSGGTLYNNIPVAETQDNVMVLQNTLNNPAFVDSYDQLLNANTDTTAPASYLNYIFFDENFQMVPESSAVFQNTGVANQWNTVGTATPVTIGQPGYILFFTASKMSSSIYWDQIAVTYYKGSVLEENHYYPFGLTLNTTPANPNDHSKYQLTTKELQDEHNLNWYDFGARMQDEQIGRWIGEDIKSEKYYNLSPYCFVGDMPSRAIDPNGMNFFVGNNNGKVSKEDRRFFKMLNKASGNIYQLNKKTGEVSFAKGKSLSDVKNSKGVSNALATAVANGISAKQDVYFRGVSESHNVDFDKYKTGEVDVADLSAMDENARAALMGHFITERFATADYEKNKEKNASVYSTLIENGDLNGAKESAFGRAHEEGIKTEAKVITETTGYPVDGTRLEILNKDPSGWQYFEYGNGVEIKFLQNMDGAISNGILIKQ